MQTIVIADRGTALRLVRNDDALVFESLEALDRWRAAPPHPQTIAREVEQALAETGRAASELPAEVSVAMQRIARSESVPRVRELFGALPERTFYRRWTDCMPVSPKQFLARVRLLHAARLLEESGCSAKEAAYRAGYRSTWDLNRALGRNRRDVAGKEVARFPSSPHVVGIS